MNREYYWDPEAATVMVNVTETYDAELRKLLADLGEEFSWVGVEYSTVCDDDGDVTEWMWLHKARAKVPA
jgi:hypothetical protein